MLESIRNRYCLIFRFAGTFIIFSVVVGIVFQPRPATAEQGYLGCLDLLYDSEACHCIQERTLEIQETIKQMILSSELDTSLIRCLKFDLSTYYL